MRVPVLTYHAVNIAGNDYATNDHAAFAADLSLIDEMGLRVIPLSWVVDQLLGIAHRDLNNAVGDTGEDVYYAATAVHAGVPCSALLGYAPQQLRAMTWDDISHPDDAASIRRTLAEAEADRR